MKKIELLKKLFNSTTPSFIVGAKVIVFLKHFRGLCNLASFSPSKSSCFFLDFGRAELICDRESGLYSPVKNNL